jgi:hypothetical protein
VYDDIKIHKKLNTLFNHSRRFSACGYVTLQKEVVPMEIFTLGLILGFIIATIILLGLMALINND